MRRSKYSESQIVFAIKQVETGTRIQEVCRKMGVSEATFYNWKKKYGGLGVSELRRLKNLEEENSQLKKLVADLSLDKQILQDVLKKKVLRPSRKRGMVCNIRMEYNISIQRCCKLVLLHKSVFYYKAKGRRSDKLLRMRMNEIAAVRVRYGFWRIHILLRREGFMDNHKRMYRVYCEEGLNLRSKRPKRNRSAAHRQPSEGNASSLNECWSMDFVCDQFYNGNRFRALTVVDNYSRKCLAIHAGKSLKGSDVVQVMEAITFGNEVLPKRVKVDNGSEFISKILDKWAYENNVELDFSRPGKPTDNPFIESFNGSFRDECLNANWFFSLEDAQEKFDIWREDYNGFRPHSSLGDMSPNEYIGKNENSPDSLVMTGT
ncbi:IS3 family transposase [Zobellia galactanivorans]|uniref:IS3 family transposase n=1 Tax=Zobellia galactanivorans (strain DSM 12802 / CCUG 47099 / CIP 106680 / NCIMB 13871 / Dsij) TaxID=63186 RepID=UPI0026E1B514|nr:IS3 family transposase [Zobellia galactanivorans]MDO6811330.1 IS3 family transposase [Zobellia galactanivorans]